jgi:DNA polymerase III subunit epsilon
MRQIVLDTETTGLVADQGHRIIEIGAVEMLDRRLTGRHFHCYLNPERDIDPGALDVHGITVEFLADKPKFGDVLEEFLAFVRDSEVIIHNAPFDVSFLNYEFSLLAGPKPRDIRDHCAVTDSLAIARHKHPGQKNGLDALCRRYLVDNSARTLHGALLDAEILADVFLAMTGGQTALFDVESETDEIGVGIARPMVRFAADRPRLVVVRATQAELALHDARLDELDRSCEDGSVWRRAVA